jgi:RimJ/RimL family protein N-acetyltransferase
MARPLKKHPILVTERPRLRPFRSTDLDVLHALYSDADNLRYWSVSPYSRIEQTRRALRWHIAYRPRFYAIWAVEEKKSRRVVGMINYNRRDVREKRAELGWLALPAFQGRGFMTEAARALLRHLFDDLGVHKVEAQIQPQNKPSIALAKRLGFRKEGGPMRDRWRVGDQWRSVMLYGLIAGEEK